MVPHQETPTEVAKAPNKMPNGIAPMTKGKIPRMPANTSLVGVCSTCCDMDDKGAVDMHWFADHNGIKLRPNPPEV